MFRIAGETERELGSEVEESLDIWDLFPFAHALIEVV